MLSQMQRLIRNEGARRPDRGDSGSARYQWCDPTGFNDFGKAPRHVALPPHAKDRDEHGARCDQPEDEQLIAQRCEQGVAEAGEGVGGHAACSRCIPGGIVRPIRLSDGQERRIMRPFSAANIRA